MRQVPRAAPRRIDDPGVIAACRQELAELYDKGKDLLACSDREITLLPPPCRTEGDS